MYFNSFQIKTLNLYYTLSKISSTRISSNSRLTEILSAIYETNRMQVDTKQGHSNHTKYHNSPPVEIQWNTLVNQQFKCIDYIKANTNNKVEDEDC